ncbi:hypothetical protein STEG23_024380 [Scotinomys teguina]
MTVTPLGRDQDCSLKIREPDVPASWFLDPGGWSKTAAVRLYFIFPGICTLSLQVEDLTPHQLQHSGEQPCTSPGQHHRANPVGRDMSEQAPELIVRETPISGVHTFYTDANKQGKAGYKSEDLSKVVQSPYNSVQKSELYAILLVLMDFSEPLNIVTDSQYAERVVLHIETAEFIPDESELTSLFIQLQDIIRNRKHPLYITHIRSHTGLPGPLAQGNDEIDKLLIGNVLEASEFHKKHHVNSKGLKRDFSITWQQAKEIVRKCPTCSFYNQTPLPAGCNPKGYSEE